MKPNDPRLIAAEAEAQAARARLLDAAEIARARLAPAALKKEATDKIMDTALDGIERARTYAKGHPMQIVALGAVLGGYVARRPLMALFARWAVKAKDEVQRRRQRKE